MKIVINACYGGFSLSMAAVKRYAELSGRPCYFFRMPDLHGPFVPFTGEKQHMMDIISAFDIPNPNVDMVKQGNWAKMSPEERIASNELYRKHEIENRPEKRDDPLLVQVVEELGEKANGSCAKLKIVEIPDGTEWQLSEYDGIETVDEKHRSWA